MYKLTYLAITALLQYAESFHRNIHTVGKLVSHNLVSISTTACGQFLTQLL